ncbi:MAG: tripartite tricarboxylate transporter substrate binding protein [Betaproteobacteria bacterium]|nr:tripartite tricarboxylate transporter substrate binding protein [Betaproteobacteria bacterium]
MSKMLLLIAASLIAAPAVQAAESGYPNRPVRVIVPFSPGGATDIVARLVAQKLGEIWGQTAVVDNRAGAGGNIGGDIAAKSPPDGYTLFFTSGSIVTANQHMYAKMPFNPEKDFIGITNVASGPQAIVVNPSSTAKTVKDLIDIAKAKPRAMTFGSAGIGTQTHLAAENFIHAAGIEVTHIPYKGEGPALTDLVGGQIQFVTPNLSAAINQVNAGKLRALAVTSRERSPQLPNVPAVAETLPGFENLGWFGFMVPTGTPRAVVAKLHADIIKALQSPDLRKRVTEIGMVTVGNTQEEFARELKSESARWAKIIKERGLLVK